MARTLDEIRASRPQVDRAKVSATTEADIRRHAREDDSEAAAPLAEFVKRLPGQRGPGKRQPKVQVTLRVQPEALQAWKATGEGWMSRAAEHFARGAPAAGSVVSRVFDKMASPVRDLDERTLKTLEAAGMTSKHREV